MQYTAKMNYFTANANPYLLNLPLTCRTQLSGSWLANPNLTLHLKKKLFIYNSASVYVLLAKIRLWKSQVMLWT